MASTRDSSISIHDQVFLDRRKVLAQLFHGQAYMRDRSVIFLASGAVGLSLLVLDAAGKNPSHMTLVFGSWGSCAISLIAALMSFSFGQIAIGQEIEYCDNLTLGDKEDAKEPNAWPLQTVKWLNRLSVLSFAAGVIFLLVFSWCNLPH